MGLYFCPNCRNLKIRVVQKKDLRGLSKYKVNKALRNNDEDALGLSFPLNLATHKRLTKYGMCKIIYCSEDMLSRRLYIYREKLEGSLTPDKTTPCSKFR